MARSDKAPKLLTLRQEDVVLCRMEGLSRPDCGERFDVTASAIKRMMVRAAKRNGLKQERQLWLAIASGRIPLRAAARKRLNELLG